MKIDDHSILKRQIAASFGTKVAGYSDNAIIQKQLLDRLLPLIIQSGNSEALWIDAGCGNGMLEEKLHAAGFTGTLYAFDISLQSLFFCKKQQLNQSTILCADIDMPPFKPACSDGIISASVLQWSDNLDQALRNISSLLRQNGYFIFSMFTCGSFRELVEMREKFNLPQTINLPHQNEIELLLDKNHLVCTEKGTFSDILYFPSAMQLLKHLSAIGSTGGVPSQRMPRAALQKFCSAFEETFGTPKGIPLTYKAFFGSARKGPLNG